MSARELIKYFEHRRESGDGTQSKSSSVNLQAEGQKWRCHRVRCCATIGAERDSWATSIAVQGSFREQEKISPPQSAFCGDPSDKQLIRRPGTGR